jgi:hypothetical protein
MTLLIAKIAKIAKIANIEILGALSRRLDVRE